MIRLEYHRCMKCVVVLIAVRYRLYVDIMLCSDKKILTIVDIADCEDNWWLFLRQYRILSAQLIEKYHSYYVPGLKIMRRWGEFFSIGLFNNFRKSLMFHKKIDQLACLVFFKHFFVFWTTKCCFPQKILFICGFLVFLAWSVFPKSVVFEEIDMFCPRIHWFFN